MTFDLLSRLAEIGLSHVPADEALIVALDGRGRRAFEKFLGHTEAGLAERAVRDALETENPVLLPALLPTERVAAHITEGDESCPSILRIPWSVNGRPGGCVCLVREGGRSPYSRENLEFLALLFSPAMYLLSKGSGKDLAGLAGAGPSGHGAGPFLGTSPSLHQVRTLIEKVSGSDMPVFLQGESGTGKELAARTIHEQGPRRGGGFIAVNCGAIPETLLESELFGHARGAFTGALRDKTGLIEEAHGGTFFLDEIGDLPVLLQAKLLRVLEEKRIRRVGENRSRPVDARFISATNKNIEEEVARKTFREDLLFRLKIIGIDLPPLRERREDIPLLVDHFLDEFSAGGGMPRPFFSPLALELLISYDWPGNVRELQNEIQRCLVISGGTSPLTEDLLSPKINPRGETGSPAFPRFFEARAAFEKRFLKGALARCHHHRTRTAAEVGLTRQGLFKLIKKHGLD